MRQTCDRCRKRFALPLLGSSLHDALVDCNTHLGRLGEPEEVAEAVLYLATAPFCNGTILNISGGNVRAVMC